jgi:DNA repair exonuclease SbcCD ATPase subunit
MVTGGRGHGAEASSSRAGPPASGEERVDEPPSHFADAQKEQQLWEELRNHGASLNRALNEALRIHGGPAWRVFQVRCCCFFSLVSFPCLFLAARCLLVSVCWRQELKNRARDKYGALDQMSAELRQLREQRDALDALAEALRTPDSWLAYRAEALRDQLLELEGQATARPSAIERIRTALIDRDEALQQARRDAERAHAVATDWEAEVISQNQEVRTWLLEAQSQQSRAEERAREDEQRAKEAEELKAALTAKVAAVATAEEQLR